jgi:phosphoserine phosphatase
MEKYPIDFCVINDLARDGDLCSGEAIIHLAHEGKGVIARDLIERYNANYVVAFGDSRGDIPVFNLANFSIAVNANDSELLNLATHQHVGLDLSKCLEKLPF